MIRTIKRKLNKVLLILSKKTYQIKYMLKNQDSNKNIVFIAGAQRSGTNMIMGVFDRNYKTHVFHERDNKAYIDYELKSKEVISNLLGEVKVNNIFINIS